MPGTVTVGATHPGGRRAAQRAARSQPPELGAQRRPLVRHHGLRAQLRRGRADAARGQRRPEHHPRPRLRQPRPGAHQVHPHQERRAPAVPGRGLQPHQHAALRAARAQDERQGLRQDHAHAELDQLRLDRHVVREPDDPAGRSSSSSDGEARGPGRRSGPCQETGASQHHFRPGPGPAGHGDPAPHLLRPLAHAAEAEALRGRGAAGSRESKPRPLSRTRSSTRSALEREHHLHLAPLASA